MFGVWGLGFGVCGLVFGVWGLWFGVWGSGGLGLGLMVWGLEVHVEAPAERTSNDFDDGEKSNDAQASWSQSGLERVFSNNPGVDIAQPQR